MKTLNEQIKGLVEIGYRRLPAQAKVAHDVLLMAMHRSGFKESSSIKGGVVMSQITSDIRRATMDMDIDFIHHSISNRSIEAFVRRLARFANGVEIKIDGEITDLKHEDYHGKRIFVAIKDDSLNIPLRTKMDIGVHTHDELVQVDCVFDLAGDEKGVELLANSNEQIFAEKLASLVRHGILSQRPKDVFDMFYLAERIDMAAFRKSVEVLVYAGKRCPAANKEELIGSVRKTFSSKRFLSKLNVARVNWLEVEPAKAVEGILAVLEAL